jgi:hypothetical protein
VTIGAEAAVWFGPVNLTQVAGATIPGAPALNVTCTGDGSPSCAAIAESWADASGRRLPALLRAKGLPEDTTIAGAAFSAGGSILKRLCLSAADRAQMAVVHSADASYEAVAGQRPFVEGYVLYALEALTDPSKLFVATASAGANKNFGSGIEIITSTRLEITRRAGQSFELGGEFPGVTPQPASLWRLGERIWIAEYPAVPHGQQATLLAPQIWQGLILPWLGGSSGPGPIPSPPGPGPTPVADGSSSLQSLLAFGMGLLLGYGGIRLWQSRG